MEIIYTMELIEQNSLPDRREKVPAKVYAIKIRGNKGTFDSKKASIILGGRGYGTGLASVKAEAENPKDKKNVLALPDIKAKAQELQERLSRKARIREMIEIARRTMGSTRACDDGKRCWRR